MADKELFPAICEAISYTNPVRKKTKFKIEIIQQIAYFIDRRNGRFLYGLLHRVTKYLNQHGYIYQIISNNEYDAPPGAIITPKLNGITFRDTQLSLINKVPENQTGIIKSPTGTGKTIIALGIISIWPKAKTLILVNKIDLLHQFKDRIDQYLPKYDTQIIKGGNKNRIKGQIVISTIQSISKYPIDSISGYFDIIICDECHHVSSRNGQYGKFLLSNLAPIKIGLTATLPTEREQLLSMEGLLGPVIGELSLKKAKKLDIITKVIIKLLPVEYNSEIGENQNYRDIYQAGIVNNNERNIKIIKTIKNYVSNDKSCLILIKNIEHGDNLIKYAKILGLDDISFVHGITEKEQREQVKNDLESKRTKCVICSDIWKEGIDIPSLNVIVIAGGGKSELQTIQSIGRGLRTSAGKEHVTVIDFLDPYRYLAEHAIRRLQLYIKYNWL